MGRGALGSGWWGRQGHAQAQRRRSAFKASAASLAGCEPTLLTLLHLPPHPPGIPAGAAAPGDWHCEAGGWRHCQRLHLRRLGGRCGAGQPQRQPGRLVGGARVRPLGLPTPLCSDLPWAVLTCLLFFCSLLQMRARAARQTWRTSRTSAAGSSTWSANASGRSSRRSNDLSAPHTHTLPASNPFPFACLCIFEPFVSREPPCCQPNTCPRLPATLPSTAWCEARALHVGGKNSRGGGGGGGGGITLGVKGAGGVWVGLLSEQQT